MMLVVREFYWEAWVVFHRLKQSLSGQEEWDSGCSFLGVGAHVTMLDTTRRLQTMKLSRCGDDGIESTQHKGAAVSYADIVAACIQIPMNALRLWLRRDDPMKSPFLIMDVSIDEGVCRDVVSTTHEHPL
jgi:alanine dehydrogenase